MCIACVCARAFVIHVFVVVVVVFVSFCLLVPCLVLSADFYLAINHSFPTQLSSFELELYIFYALVLCYLLHDPCSRFFIR